MASMTSIAALKDHVNASSFNDIVGCIIRGIPDSLQAEALRTDLDAVVNLNKARTQHTEYVNALRNLKLELYEVDVDEKLPDCCFVEDSAVVHDGVAFICRPWSPRRQGEVPPIANVLKELGLKIHEIEDKDATIEGGDVLFTGREFFVGVASRTNLAGIRELAKAFPHYQVSAIEMTKYIHLKCITSMAGPDVVVVGSSESALHAQKQMIEKSVYKYRYVTLPDDYAANCLYVNGTLIHCTKEEFPASYKVYQEEFPDIPKVALPNSELIKVDGAFTCRSIFIPTFSNCS